MHYLVKPLILQQVNHRSTLGEDATVSGVSMKQVVETWGRRLHEAYEALKQKKWKTFSGATHQEDLRAYKPTALPFFLSMDNAWSYSFWKDSKGKEFADPVPIPMLQCVPIPPRGHDLHQMPEHAIGCIKGNFMRAFKCVDVLMSEYSHYDFQDIVNSGQRLYGADAWRANIKRWYTCCLLVGTPTNRFVDLNSDSMVAEGSSSKGRKRGRHERPGTGGDYCYHDYS